MLSSSWFRHHTDSVRRATLFHGISRILLAFARFPASRIGSLRFHDDGTFSLTSRPLSCNLIIQENLGTERVINSDQTYSASEPYILDLLTSHDNRFVAQRDAATDEADCIAQLGAAVILRAILPHYFDSSTRDGPFVMTPTDLHPCDLLVDKDWNVVCLIDLEWFCALPVQMYCPPQWLTGRWLDGLTDNYLTEYNKACAEFLGVLKAMESQYQRHKPKLPSLSEHMRDSQKNGRLWYSNFLLSVDVGYNLFMQHIYKRYSSAPKSLLMYTHFSRFSRPNAKALIAKKVAEAAEYNQEQLGRHAQ